MIRPLTLAAVIALGVAGCSAQQPTADPAGPATTSAPATAPAATPAAEPATKADPAPATAHGYVSQADYEKDRADFRGSSVVLFFNATWCPTCQEAEENLSTADFPRDLTVVSVDYDSNQELRERYGVTTQHTFVVVEPDGTEIKKFTGATDVAQIEQALA